MRRAKGTHDLASLLAALWWAGGQGACHAHTYHLGIFRREMQLRKLHDGRQGPVEINRTHNCWVVCGAQRGEVGRQLPHRSAVRGGRELPRRLRADVLLRLAAN